MASWTMLGGPPKLPKEVAAVLAGGPVVPRRPAFGAPRHSTPDLTFEPQGALEEKARLRALFGRRADHLIVEQDQRSSPPRVQQTAPAASRRHQQPPHQQPPQQQPAQPQQAPPAPRRALGGSRANPSKVHSAQPQRGECAATMKPTVMRDELDNLQLQGFSGAATMHTSAGARLGLPGTGVRPSPPTGSGGTATFGAAATAASAADAAAAQRLSSASPVTMQRARVWSAEVEDAFRLQMAGYRDLQELLLLGEPMPERWDDGKGFIKKLCCRETISGERRVTYFRKARECEDSDLHTVKLYAYEEAE